MTFQITVNGKTLKNAVTGRPMTFETVETTTTFANSARANWISNWKNQGRCVPKYEVVEVVA